jgi:hypothetical protein
VKSIRIDLGSTRLAFVLIALLVVHVLAAAVIPQQGIAQQQFLDLVSTDGIGQRIIEFLRLDRIYTTWPFHVLLGLLAANLVVGNVQRFTRIYRTERTLLRLRHLGSIVFHLALVAVLLGAIGNYMFRFHGVFALTEGQSATDTDDAQGYFRVFPGPLGPDPPGEFRLTMEKIEPQWEQDGVTTIAARMRLEAAGEPPLTDTVRFGHPLRWRSRELHLGARTGFSPEVLLERANGSVIFRSFVRVAAANHEGVDVHSDFIELPGQLSLSLEIHEPDGPEPRRWLSASKAGAVLFEGYVADDDTVSIDGARLSSPRMRRWTFVEVRQNPGLFAVFWGFWVALGGLSLTLVARVRNESRREGVKV